MSCQFCALRVFGNVCLVTKIIHLSKVRKFLVFELWSIDSNYSSRNAMACKYRCNMPEDWCCSCIFNHHHFWENWWVIIRWSCLPKMNSSILTLSHGIESCLWGITGSFCWASLYFWHVPYPLIMSSILLFICGQKTTSLTLLFDLVFPRCSKMFSYHCRNHKLCTLHECSWNPWQFIFILRKCEAGLYCYPVCP